MTIWMVDGRCGLSQRGGVPSSETIATTDAVDDTACPLSTCMQVTPMLKVTVCLCLSGEHVCTVQRSPADTVGSLLRAVSAAAPQSSAFDLLFHDRILRIGETLFDEGMYDDSLVALMRRELRATDLTVKTYSEGCVGCLNVVYLPSGAELCLRGARVGSGKEKLSCELYAGPAWVENEDDDVFVYYQKTVGVFSAANSSTTHVKVRRPLRMRSDIAVARHEDGGMWVSFRKSRNAEHEFGATVFSGMRLKILDACDPDWLHVRSHSQGEGWVRRRDTDGVGEVSLDWAGPENILSENVADQVTTPLFDYTILF
eukprot:TRINITY_DN37191_c0_g1_i1.p1 TRINITY_DN37191_c0_g1~~TRINITY_DN37191_c0_g1_i1.p1  ORF type:complete len:314 (+),score=48.23 TRINITY_DN37191_c0_g1_i1:96-1037(+)